MHAYLGADEARTQTRPTQLLAWGIAAIFVLIALGSYRRRR